MSDLRSRLTSPDGQALQDRAWAQHGWTPQDARPWQRIFSQPPGHDGVLDDSLFQQEAQQALDCQQWRDAGYEPREAWQWDYAVGPNPLLADRWRAAGLDPTQASHWLGIASKGLLHDAARQSNESDADLALRYAATGLPGDMVDLALSNGFSFDEVKEYTRPEQWQAVEALIALGGSAQADHEDEPPNL